MWRIHFEAPIGKRILKSRFCGLTYYNSHKTMWWSRKLKKWIAANSNEYLNCDHNLSSHADVHSYKAFLRHLKKHTNELKDSQIVLESRFIGYDIIAEWKD